MTADEVADVYEMRLMAETDPDYVRYCTSCKAKVFFISTTEAFCEGQIYSEEGVREYTRNSGFCEFCFDALFREEEEEPASAAS